MWTFSDFDAYRERWPDTPVFERPDDAPTAWLRDHWEDPADAIDAEIAEIARDLRVVFVRGYLGNWMPGNLVAPTRALEAIGVGASIVPTRTSETAQANVARIASYLEAIDDRVVLCGHSKGGLECLMLCGERPDLAERVAGVILSQTPRGPSAVMESLLDRAHEESLQTRRWIEEWTQRLGLYAIGAQRGGRQLTRGPMAELIAGIDTTALNIPVWQTASWSSRPTTWLDSFHERLGEIRPGCAHDGQFFLEDLIWPEIPHVLLAHVDHAQPAMGGFGFDHTRYWKLLIRGLLEAA